MQIKMITLSAGPDGNLHPGALVDKPEKEARELIAGGYAVAVSAEKVEKPAEKDGLKIETQTTAPAETAALGAAGKKDFARPEKTTGKA